LILKHGNTDDERKTCTNKKTDSCDTVTKNSSALSEIDGDLFVAQEVVFILGGYETSASTLSFSLYELALHPDIQQSLRAEILQVLSRHDGELTYEGIQDMSYLDRFVSGEERRYLKQ
jgi:cytochrome P450 family 6